MSSTSHHHVQQINALPGSQVLRRGSEAVSSTPAGLLTYVVSSSVPANDEWHAHTGDHHLNPRLVALRRQMAAMTAAWRSNSSTRSSPTPQRALLGGSRPCWVPCVRSALPVTTRRSKLGSSVDQIYFRVTFWPKMTAQCPIVNLLRIPRSRRISELAFVHKPFAQHHTRSTTTFKFTLKTALSRPTLPACQHQAFNHARTAYHSRIAPDGGLNGPQGTNLSTTVVACVVDVPRANQATCRFLQPTPPTLFPP